MPAIAWAVRSQPNTLTLVLLALALDGGDRAHQRRLAGGVDRRHVGIAGDQVLGRGEGVVLDVLAVDDAGHGDARGASDGLLEALLADVLDEGVQRADDADLALPPMFAVT